MRHYLISLGLIIGSAVSVRSETAVNANAPVAEVKAVLQERSETVKAAHDFAASLPTDDQAKAIQNFAAAYTLAKQAKEDTPQATVTTPAVATRPTVWQTAALTSKTFQGNFVKTLNATIDRKSVIGDPVPVNWRIIDGQTTDSFTDCVAIGRADGNNRRFYCSGTVINRRAVLTAGHCANGEKAPIPNIVLIGPGINNGTTIEVAKIITHPQLNLGQHPFNDLALLILKEPVPDTVTVRSIGSEDQLYDSYQVTCVGYGTDSRAGGPGFGLKRSTDVAIITYDGRQPDGAAPFGCDVDLEFAASSLDIFRPRTVRPMSHDGHPAPVRRPDTCRGDSGGPAYVRGSGDSWVLAGTTSRPIANAAEYVSPGEKPTDCGDGGIYVRVDRYWSNWIETVIANEHLDSP